MTLESLFDTGLIDRLQGQCEMAGTGLDVRLVATDIADMVRRKAGTKGAVRNPSGMLVARVRKILDEQSSSRGGARLDSQRRYADFVVELYRAVALKQLSPEAIADRLERARGDGYPGLNPLVAETLRGYGAAWPEESVAC